MPMPPLPQPMRRAPPLAIVLCAILTGCSTTTASSVPTDRVACGAFRPIYWSGRDTPATVAQVKEHNAAGKALCGWERR